MKNKSLIVNICLAVVSALVIAFLALPFYGLSGYSYFEALPYIGNATADIALFYISPLFILLASIILLVFAVLNILGNTNVLKSEKLLKISRIIALVAACVLTLFALIAFIFLFAQGGAPEIGLILITVLAIATIVGTSLVLSFEKK